MGDRSRNRGDESPPPFTFSSDQHAIPLPVYQQKPPSPSIDPFADQHATPLPVYQQDQLPRQQQQKKKRIDYMSCCGCFVFFLMLTLSIAGIIILVNIIRLAIIRAGDASGTEQVIYFADAQQVQEQQTKRSPPSFLSSSSIQALDRNPLLLTRDDYDEDDDPDSDSHRDLEYERYLRHRQQRKKEETEEEAQQLQQPTQKIECPTNISPNDPIWWQPQLLRQAGCTPTFHLRPPPPPSDKDSEKEKEKEKKPVVPPKDPRHLRKMIRRRRQLASTSDSSSPSSAPPFFNFPPPGNPISTGIIPSHETVKVGLEQAMAGSGSGSGSSGPGGSPNGGQIYRPPPVAVGNERFRGGSSSSSSGSAGGAAPGNVNGYGYGQGNEQDNRDNFGGFQSSFDPPVPPSRQGNAYSEPKLSKGVGFKEGHGRGHGRGY